MVLEKKYPVSEGDLNSGENSVEGVEGEKMSLHFFSSMEIIVCTVKY